MLDFFIAGTATTQNVTQAIFSHFATDPNSLHKLRDEFDSHLKEKLNSDQSVKELSPEDQLNEVTTLDFIQGLTYLNQVVMEALRFRPPVFEGSPMQLHKDITVGKYKLK